MMLDGILGRLSSRFLFSMLCLENSPLREHGDLIVYSCVRAAKGTDSPVCTTWFDFSSPGGFLCDQHRAIWQNDPINTENILSTIAAGLTGKNLQSLVSPKALQTLQDAQNNEQVIIIPSFGEQLKLQSPF